MMLGNGADPNCADYTGAHHRVAAAEGKIGQRFCSTTVQTRTSWIDLVGQPYRTRLLANTILWPQCYAKAGRNCA